MTDQTTTISECKQYVDSFLREREWHQFHSPKVDSVGLAVEAGELLELFLFSKLETGGQDVLAAKRESVEDELIDILYWTLCFANTTSIDLARAVGLTFGVQITDAQTTISDLKTLIGQSPVKKKTLIDKAMTISYKASCLMRLFLEENADQLASKEKIESLVADVLISIMQFVEDASIDVAKAFVRKTAKNALKYPVEKSKGVATKYTDL